MKLLRIIIPNEGNKIGHTIRIKSERKVLIYNSGEQRGVNVLSCWWFMEIVNCLKFPNTNKGCSPFNQKLSLKDEENKFAQEYSRLQISFLITYALCLWQKFFFCHFHTSIKVVRSDSHRSHTLSTMVTEFK